MHWTIKNEHATILYMHTVSLFTNKTLPEEIRSTLWTGASLGQAHTLHISSGHPALDAQLPGEGWPTQTLIEVLPDHGNLGGVQIFLPVAKKMIRQGGSVILISPRQVPYLPSWMRDGIPPDRLIWIQAQTQADRLWATQKALQARALTLIACWLPQARPDHMRRLQGYAKQHPGLLFAIRPYESRQEPSAAPLRIAVSRSMHSLGLDVQILKRRGLPLHDPVHLPPHQTDLAHLVRPVDHAALDRLDTGLSRTRELALQ
ncbi:MAG: translesion DNA synthesis-associated protein ImuA [Aquabacterium sp.]